MMILFFIFFLLSPAVYAQWNTGPFGDSEWQNVEIKKHVFGCQELDSSPGLPDLDGLRFYCKDSGGTTKLYTMDSNGVETALGASSGSTGNVGIGTTGWPAYYASSGSTVAAFSGMRFVGSNVGIGSATPGTALDVTGAIRASSTLAASNFSGTHSGTSSGTNTGDQTNISGNAATVTTNANLTGPITSVGNATSIAAQTGTGTTFVTQTSPTLTTPVLGVATGTSLTTTGNIGVGTTNISTAALTVMSGNVGVGTWIPNGVLNVSGNVNIGSTAASSSLVVGGTSSNFSVTNQGLQQIITNSTGANITTTGSSTGQGVMVSAVQSGSTFSGRVFDAQISGASATGTGIRVRNSGTGYAILTDNGNVGIGTLGVGNLGIGTTIPMGLLTLKAAGGALLSQQTTPPTVANNDCGTTTQGTIVAKSTDLSGTVTVGTLAVTSCAITFNTAFNGAPNCLCMDDSNVLAVRCTATTTKLTITSLSSMASDLVTWWCPSNT